MNVNEMSKTELLQVKSRERFDQRIICRSIVIIPLGRKHDSGYPLMEICAVDENGEPVCLVSGCSDVIHIEGISGYGDRRENSGVIPGTVPVAGWSIDILPKSKLVRLWPSSYKRHYIICDMADSSFEIYSAEKP